MEKNRLKKSKLLRYTIKTLGIKVLITLYRNKYSIEATLNKRESKNDRMKVANMTE
jgi:hypothetical protein